MKRAWHRDQGLAIEGNPAGLGGSRAKHTLTGCGGEPFEVLLALAWLQFYRNEWWN